MSWQGGVIMEIEKPKIDDHLEYLTISEFAQRVRRTAKTAYNWINKGMIGGQDGVVTIQGRIFIHWPTYSARQIRPYRRVEDNLRAPGG
jgi:hypothetical protein